MPSTIGASLLFDRGSGIFATFLSALLALFFFIEPNFSFTFENSGLVLEFIVFLIVGVFTAMIIEALRVSIDELADVNAGLEDSQAKHRAVINTAADAIIIIDSKGIILSFNLAAEKIFGYAAAEVKGKNVKILMAPDEARAHDGYIANYLQTGKAKVIGIGREVEGQRKDGARVPMYLSIAEWRDVKGQRYFTGIMRDITAQKEEAGFRAHAMRELEETNRKLDDFVYIVSHDLKEPVRGINTFSRFLLEDYSDRLDKNGKETLRALQTMSERMQEMISDLLHYSLLDREQAVYERVDVEQTVASILELMEIQLKDQNVKISVAQNLPAMFCSKAHIAEIFRNLITNAVKYNDKPQKEVEIGIIDEHEKSGDRPVFFVRDNGIGIPEQHKDAVFKMFRRLHGRDQYGGGTGSGLAIVKRVIDQNGGEIWLESKPGEGTTFYFYLNCGELKTN